MSTSVTGVTTNFFPSAESGFTTTTSGSVSSGATTVGLASVAGYTNGEVAVFVIDPTDSVKKQTFTGVIDTAGSQVTNVVWTAGTNQTHALGATVVDYATATHISMMTKGLTKAIFDQDGTMKAGAVDNSAAITDGIVTRAKLDSSVTAELNQGWISLGDTPDTVTYNGNRSYTLVYNNEDHTDVLSPGMRKRFTRTVAAPTQCADLESSSSQYFSRASASVAGMTFTDDFTFAAWIKVESYTGALQPIASRSGAGINGFRFELNASGQLQTVSLNSGGNNRTVATYQSIPLNKWTHVAMTTDNSTNTHVAYIDGVAVPTSTATTGTVTAIVQSGDFYIGTLNGLSSFFDGKIAQASVHSAVLTATQIRAMMNQTIDASSPNIVAGYTFNGVLTDVSANGNTLTANGGATATNADSPFGVQASGLISSTTDYGIVTSATFSTNTTVVVQVPEGNTIPTSGGVTAVSYSGVKAPYGMPIARDKWRLETINRTQASVGSAVASTWYNISSPQITIPTGVFSTGYNVLIQHIRAAGASNIYSTLSTANNTESDRNFSAGIEGNSATVGGQVFIEKSVTYPSQTVLYLNTKTDTASASTLYNRGDTALTTIYAELAYL